jgi:hypothetical protein
VHIIQYGFSGGSNVNTSYIRSNLGTNDNTYSMGLGKIFNYHAENGYGSLGSGGFAYRTSLVYFAHDTTHWGTHCETLLGVQDVTADLPISLHPTPTSTTLTITATRELIGTAYTLTDLMGRAMRVGKLEAETTQLNVGDLSAGVYLLTINGRGYKVLIDN